MKKTGRTIMAAILACILCMPACMTTAQAKGKVVDLDGKYVTSYNSRAKGAIAGIEKLTDGQKEEDLKINRNGGQNIAYAVYDAGEGQTFTFDAVEISGSNAGIWVFGTNDNAITTSVPSQGTDYSKENYGLFVSEFHLELSSNGELWRKANSFSFSGYRYLVIVFSKWDTTSISEYTFMDSQIKVADAQIGDVIGVDKLTISQGSSGSDPYSNVSDFGVVKDATDDTMGLLGMQDGDPVKLPRVNAIDGGNSAQYGGWVSADIETPRKGTYRVSILGSTVNARGYVVTVNNGETYPTNYNGSSNGSGSIATGSIGTEHAYYYWCDVDLPKGINTIKVNGNGGSPNFMIMAVTTVPGKTYKVTVKEDGEDGEGTVFDVDQGKMVACHSDHDVAWTIDDEVLAIGKKFTYIPTDDVTIVAKEISPEMTAQGIVTEKNGTVAGNKFTVTFGEGVSGDVTFTFITGDEPRQTAEVTAPVGEFAGQTVEYTITGAGDKNIQYVIARKEA